MRHVSASEAKQRLAAVDAAQREPVTIRRRNREVAVVLSPLDYRRLTAANDRDDNRPLLSPWTRRAKWPSLVTGTCPRCTLGGGLRSFLLASRRAIGKGGAPRVPLPVGIPLVVARMADFLRGSERLPDDGPLEGP